MKIKTTDFHHLETYCNFKICLERAKVELGHSTLYLPLDGMRDACKKIQEISNLLNEIEFE